MTDKSMIQRVTPLNEIGQKFPFVSEILADEYGMHCATCSARTATETLEQGARLHGMSNDQIDELVLDLNERILEGK